MKRALGCLFALLIAISFTRVAVAISGPPFDFRLQLAVLHPEIYGHPQFQTWNTPIRLAAWSEEPRMPDGTQIVFVRAAGPPSGADTLAFRIQHHEDGTNTVLEVRSFSGAEVQVSYDDAVAALRTKSLQPITSAELSIDFAAATRLGWRLTTSTRSFDIRGADIEISDGLESLPMTLPHDCTLGGDDSLSEDDLHHPGDPQINSYAHRPVKVSPTLSLQGQAETLCHLIVTNVPRTEQGGAAEYTDSDLRTFKRGGSCDEKAVLLVTYLRALGIPARMKFLIWSRGGDTWGHACVEYVVNNTVHFLDPTLDYVDDPEHYRKLTVDGLQVRNVMVVDVDWPADARSTTPVGAAQLDDTDSQDGRLNPWGDFCYSPTPSGEPRDRYSRDVPAMSLVQRAGHFLTRFFHRKRGSA